MQSKQRKPQTARLSQIEYMAISMSLAVTLTMSACAQASAEYPHSADGAPMAELCLASDTQPASTDFTDGHEIARVQTELALTDEQRARGLMHREHLAADAGMLFYYPNSQYRSFWMFSTLIPLDIAYLNDAGEILQIITMQPCLSDNPGRCRGYESDARARAALELNAGRFAELGVSAGDYVLDADCQSAPWAEGW